VPNTPNSGTDAAFSTFYAAAWPRLFRTTLAVAGDPGLAEDALQTAFASAYRLWWRVVAADDPLAYVRRIAVNAALTQHRKGFRKREWSVDVLPERPVPVSELDGSDRARVWDAVECLPSRQRAVVVLRYYEDLSEREIAEVLGCRPGTVKSQASSALDTLRRRLTDDQSAFTAA
jgi:RNA polymerase sigma-70 factor (sigma-E family)